MVQDQWTDKGKPKTKGKDRTLPGFRFALRPAVRGGVEGGMGLRDAALSPRSEGTDPALSTRWMRCVNRAVSCTSNSAAESPCLQWPHTLNGTALP